MILGIGIGLIVGFLCIIIVMLVIGRRNKEETSSWLVSQNKLLSEYWDRNNNLREVEVRHLEDIAQSVRDISQRPPATQ